MDYLSLILVLLVALEHIYILVLEMFLWHRPRTLKIFGIPKEDGELLKVMAANQGLYNGFLAAGLLWGLLYPEPIIGQQIQLFFLVCVLVAAIYGGFSVKKSIWGVQGGPALLALIAVLCA
jgi:putative membrane protein